MPNRLIINLRGPNGSGKTTTARMFLRYVEDAGVFPYEREGKQRLWLWHRCRVPGLEMPVYVMGRYDVQQGGCDTEKDMDAIERCVQRAVEELTDGHVFFEGFTVSKSGGRWLEFANRAQKAGNIFVWAFLEPPVDELSERIMKRNGGKEPKRDLLENTCRTVYLVRQKVKAVARKGCLINLDWHQPAPMVYEQLLLQLAEIEQAHG